VIWTGIEAGGRLSYKDRVDAGRRLYHHAATVKAGSLRDAPKSQQVNGVSTNRARKGLKSNSMDISMVRVS
jgi:hypothetical protein